MVVIEEITETQYEKVLRLKCEGNDAFKRRENAKAKNLYTQALQILVTECKADDSQSSPPLKATLLSNRCQVNLALDDAPSALEDATASVAAAPSWPKAHHRLGSVQMRAGQYALAFEAYQRASQLNPEDIDLTNACTKAHEAMAEHGMLTEAAVSPDAEITLEEAKPTGAPAEQTEEVEAAAAVKCADQETKLNKAAAVQSVEVKAAAQSVEVPTEVPPKKMATGGESAPEYTLEELDDMATLRVQLPALAALGDTAVDVSETAFRLHAPGHYLLELTWPWSGSADEAKAKFLKKSRTLQVTIPLVV